MEIIKSKWKPSGIKNGGILHNGRVYNGTLELLVDKIPKVEFEQKGLFYYGEKDGYVEVYKHEPGSTRGFAGRDITLKFKDGSEKTFHGSLWDPFGIPKELNWFNVSITEDPKVFEKGWTYYGGKITIDLAKKLIEKLNPEPDVKVEADNFFTGKEETLTNRREWLC